jgi:hypothetical protein
VTRDTFPGSKWNFIGGRAQAGQPLLNSECGNVRGDDGSTGDCDWSWDYHIIMNEFRRHPRIRGWLYTEHHDVINEWNGYYRYDRTDKFPGLDGIVDGMTLRDLHDPCYIAPGGELCRDAQPGETAGDWRLLRFAPNTFRDSQWSVKQWNVLDGLRVNGAGYGYFEYRVPWPDDLDLARIEGGSLLFEASAKQLFGKDRPGAAAQSGDFMRGQGAHDPSPNPNAYPMTATVKFPSAVRVGVAGQAPGQFDLPDDPADHRGILSWHAQKRDRKLREAGSYGYLIRAQLSSRALRAAAQAKEFVIRFEVDAALPGGLAVYGERFGRYRLDPTLVLAIA